MRSAIPRLISNEAAGVEFSGRALDDGDPTGDCFLCEEQRSFPVHLQVVATTVSWTLGPRSSAPEPPPPPPELSVGLAAVDVGPGEKLAQLVC